MTDQLPVVVKPITKTGAKLFGQARRLGNSASSSESESKNQIQDGYILRAVRSLQSYNVFIIDPPALLLFSGHALDTRNELGSVGNRDELQDKKSTKTYRLARENANDSQTVLPSPPMPPKEGDGAPTAFYQVFPPQLYEGGLMAIGYRRVPMASISSVAQMDTYDHFTYAQNVSIGLTLTLPQLSMSKFLTQTRANYLSLNTF